MPIVIGLVGQPSAGKGTVAEMIVRCAKEANLTTASCRSRDILRETLDLWDIEANRANLQKLPELMTSTQGFGEGALSRALHKRLMTMTSDIVIADGMRWPSDEKMLRELPASVILYITADTKIRFERLKKRQGVGEKDKTWKEFLAEEKAMTESYISTFGSHADWKIENNGTPKELEADVRLFFQKFVLPKLNSRAT